MVEGRDDIVIKLLSQDPGNYDDAPIEGIRRILEKATGRTLPRGEKLNTAEFANFSVRMGTTVATNALLERKGTKLALLITKGFEDALTIGNQSRPHLFKLNIERPSVLVSTLLPAACYVYTENLRLPGGLSYSKHQVAESARTV